MVAHVKLAVILCASVMLVSGLAYTVIQLPARETERTNPVVPQPHPTNPSGTNTSGSPPVTPPGSNSTDPTGPAVNFTDPSSIQELVNASNLFALKMFSNLSGDGENLFFSPYSIFTALAMCYEGAAGRTADEIRSLLHFPADNQTRWSLVSSLIKKINADNLDYSLNTANALYIIKQSKPLIEKYLDVLARYYNAGAFNLTAQDTEKARQDINSWVANRTNGMIKDILPPGALDIDAANLLVLINTIYFKGTWLKQFDPANTTQQPFHVTPQKSVQAPMMKRTDEKAVFNYTSGDGVQVLRLDYGGGDMSMLLLLPKDGNTSRLEGSLSVERLGQWKHDLSERRVDVYLPRFRLECRYELGTVLKTMGMATAFSNSADFSGINGGGLSIGRVIHKAVVDVNEEGTEAAAATAVIMSDNCIEPPVPVFKADHPFIFLIQDNETGNILFMGKVVDPTR